MQFGIRFLNKRNPKLTGIFAMTKHRLFLLLIHNNSGINNNIYPLKVLEESQHVQAYSSILMENRWVNTLRQQICNILAHDHVRVVFHTSSAASDKFVSGRED